MSIASNKNEFTSMLNAELTKYGVTDRDDIVGDFNQHFTSGLADGLTEEQVCAKLGDVGEIAKQYAGEALENIDTTAPSADGFNGGFATEPQQQYTAPNQQYTAPNQQYAAPNQQYTAPQYTTQQPTYAPPEEDRSGKIIAAVVIDVFILSWAIPSLASVALSYFSIPLSLVVSGIASLVGGFGTLFGGFSSFSTPFSSISTMFFALMILSLSGLAVILGIVIVKAMIKLIINIVNWNARAFCGHNIINNVKKA